MYDWKIAASTQHGDAYRICICSSRDEDIRGYSAYFRIGELDVGIVVVSDDRRLEIPVDVFSVLASILGMGTIGCLALRRRY